jgi:thiol-disulfide isomerase/thioredoxin
MKRIVLVNIISYFFILLFLYTGIDKFMAINTFKDQLASSPLLSSVAGFAAWALPITEIILAIVLFVPAWRLKGLYASLGLMILFTIYLVAILSIDDHLNCSCGGIVEDLSPWQHLLFNGAAIFLSALAIVAARRQQLSLRFRWLTTSGALILFVSIGWIFFMAFRAPAKIKTGFEGRLLPTFSLLLADSLTRLNTADIPTGKPFIMVGFSPWCVHCQAEMGDIIRNINRFGDTTIYFVTPFPFSEMKQFYNHFHLEKYPTIIVAVDSKNAFLHYFNTHSIPYVAIYDAKKRLKAVIPGQSSIDLLSKTFDD